MHPNGEELASFDQSIPHLTQLDFPPQIPPNSPMFFPEGIDNYDSLFADGISGSPSSLSDFQGDAWWADDNAAPMEAFRDGRSPCGTDADMLGVNDDVAAPQAAHPVHLCGGGHGHAAAPWPCCGSGTTGIQHHLEEEDADQRWLHLWKSGVEQRLFGEVEAPDEKLVEAAAPVPAPAPEDGRPSGRDADLAKVNAAIEHVERRFGSFKSAVEQDILREGRLFHTGMMVMVIALAGLENAMSLGEIKQDSPWSIVTFSGPGRKPDQPGWKEKSVTGMRAVADPSSPHPQPPPGEQRYVGFKKTLELDDDGNGNKLRAHEYTPLLPSHDGSDKLVPWEFSLRYEFKEDKREDELPPVAAVASTKRKEDEPSQEATAFTKRPKVAPKKSPVWKHMTQVHVKVAAATTTNKDGTQRKKNPHYKVMYAICHHCDQVFNADSSHGTHNLSNHLDRCNDCKCTHSHSR